MNTSQTSVILGDLKNDGIIHGIAAACVQAMHEAAQSASAERLIRLATHHLNEAGELVTPERVAAYLHTTLKAMLATSAELRWAEHALHQMNTST